MTGLGGSTGSIMPKKDFPLEKILTCSLGDYIHFTSTRVRWASEVHNYDLVGVHFTSSMESKDYNIKEFAKLVPENAEVVVDYRFSAAGDGPDSSWGYASGTALVPKKKKEA